MRNFMVDWAQLCSVLVWGMGYVVVVVQNESGHGRLEVYTCAMDENCCALVLNTALCTQHGK